MQCKANVYFEGRVVSHSVLFKNGSKKSLGLIFPGSYNFNTDAAEMMEITIGACRVKLPGEATFRPYASGTSFQVPAKASFEIAVDSGIGEYVCSFLK